MRLSGSASEPTWVAHTGRWAGRRRQRLRWLPWNEAKHDHLRPCGPADEPERATIGQETRVAVQRALARMSHRHRLGLILREYEGLSCAEIAEVMGLSRSAAKSLLYRARGVQASVRPRR